MSLLAKLRINPLLPLYLLHAPQIMHKELANADFIKRLPQKEKVRQVLFFAMDKNTLLKELPGILEVLVDDAIFWIVYPKKTGDIRSDLGRDESWKEVYKFGWEGIASSAIDNDWTALRFRHHSLIKNLKREVPMEARATEGVDYVNRTTTLPKDALESMKPYKGLAEFFNSMAFSHKREYIESIAEAKKPETRQRRIEKMVEMVSTLREKKLKAKK